MGIYHDAASARMWAATLIITAAAGRFTPAPKHFASADSNALTPVAEDDPRISVDPHEGHQGAVVTIDPPTGRPSPLAGVAIVVDPFRRRAPDDDGGVRGRWPGPWLKGCFGAVLAVCGQSEATHPPSPSQRRLRA